MNLDRIDPEAAKAFWWAVSWGGAIIFSAAIWLIEAAIAVVIAGFLGLKIIAFVKDIF